MKTLTARILPPEPAFELPLGTDDVGRAIADALDGLDGIHGQGDQYDGCAEFSVDRSSPSNLVIVTNGGQRFKIIVLRRG